MYVHLENIQFVLRILVQHMYDVVVRNGTEQYRTVFFISLFRKIQGVLKGMKRWGTKNERTDVQWGGWRTLRQLERWYEWKEEDVWLWCYTWKLFLVFLAHSLALLLSFFSKIHSFYCLILVACSFTSSNIQFMLEWPSNVYIHRYICYDILCIVLYFLLCCTSVAFFLYPHFQFHI